MTVENVIQTKSGIKINVDASAKKHICQKDYIWQPITCISENGKYLASIIENSVITCDEIIRKTKTVATNFNKKNIIRETKSFTILFAFLLITIALLIAVNISCYLIKFWAKQKYYSHLTSQITNGKNFILTIWIENE